MYQRTANWCTPLNNAPITPDEQAQLRADFEAIRETLNTSVERVPAHPRTIARRSTTRARSGGRSSRRCGTAPASRSSRATTPTCCSIPPRTREWCEFIADKIRSIVDDPADRGEADPERPPLRREAASVRDRLLRGVQQAERLARRSRSRRRSCAMTEHGIETADGEREFDIVVWATGFDFGTGALTRMGIRGRDGLALADAWARRSEDVPRRAERGLPELLLPRRSARGGRQQPALQRRPGRLRHRHARVPARPRLRHDRSRPRGRSGVDRHGRPRRGASARSARAATSSGRTSPASRAGTS